MSLTNVRMFDIVKKQYVFKVKSYTQVFMSLMILQVIAILFSFGGVGMAGSSSSSFEIDIHYYSADFVVVFTLLWGFITSILITTKAYRTDDFAFVTNRLTSGLSNLLFLLTASLIGGVTAMLSSYLIKDIMYFFRGMSFISTSHTIAAPAEFLLGLFTTALYVFLFSALGYLIGTLVQLYRGFIVLLPALLIGGLFLAAALKVDTFTFVYQLLFTESSLVIFIVKIVIIAGVSFSSAFFLSNRMEVNS